MSPVGANDRSRYDLETMHRLRLFLSLVFLVAFSTACGGDRQPSILFLRDGPAGTTQLFIQPPDDDPARQLTGVDDPAAPPIIDYAASPDGRAIAYSATTGGDGASALRAIDRDGDNDRLLLDCPDAECSAPVWSPDGRRLVYERRPWQDGVLGSPRLHWLDPASGQTIPLIAGNETPGYGARFSPSGEWLSYVSLADEGVVVYHLVEGTQRLLTSRVGSPAAWSPSSVEVVYSDIAIQAHETGTDIEGLPVAVQESSNVYLYRTIITQDDPRRRLSPDAAVADGVPAFSPDGQWLAFGRAPTGTGGRQLWLMRPDGVDARPLTEDPAVAHGPPSWSPDGGRLLFQRYHLTDPAAVASVWQLDVATGEETLVAERGYLPAWLP